MFCSGVSLADFLLLVYLLSELLYFHCEFLAVFGVLPLGGLLTLHHLQKMEMLLLQLLFL